MQFYYHVILTQVGKGRKPPSAVCKKIMLGRLQPTLRREPSAITPNANARDYGAPFTDSDPAVYEPTIPSVYDRIKLLFLPPVGSVYRSPRSQKKIIFCDFSSLKSSLVDVKYYNTTLARNRSRPLAVICTGQIEYYFQRV